MGKRAASAAASPIRGTEVAADASAEAASGAPDVDAASARAALADARGAGAEVAADAAFPGLVEAADVDEEGAGDVSRSIRCATSGQPGSCRVRSKSGLVSASDATPICASRSSITRAS